MAEKKEKQYVSDNAQLMAEWDWEKNNELGFNPQELTCGSGKKVWWKCSQKHEWESTICDKNHGNGCPYCSGRNAVKGKNDLQTVNPTLSKEWNFDKNYSLMPTDVLPNSNKKVWWKCANNHEWQATIKNRSNGKNCPFCLGARVISGVNDLKTINPSLSNEWNFDKNYPLMPTDVLPNSNKTVWWKCAKGHEWKTTIAHRNNGNACPICNSEQNTSFPEYALLYYIQKCELDVIHSYRELGYELDIYIPSKNIAIEYDGYYWHKDKIQEDLSKNQKCLENNIKLYRLREGLPSLNDTSIDYIIEKNQKNLGSILAEILSIIVKSSVDVNIKRDLIAIENLREYTKKESSFGVTNSQAAKEWNYEKNGNLIPENFSRNSGKIVWWKCNKGHEWQTQIRYKNNGSGCPYCAGQKVLIGYNDLLTINPTISQEWNYEKNTNLSPEQFTANSSKKVWWKCHKGHEWQATIDNRNKSHGCPYCANQKIMKDYNDLKTINPSLALEWNYDKNNGLTPSQVFPNSSKKVWWRCNKGHEWEAQICSRNTGRGCPVCAQNKEKHKGEFL